MNKIKIFIGILLFVIISMVSYAQDADITDLLKKIDNEMFPEIAKANIQITSYKKGSVQKISEMRMQMKKNNGLIEFTGPAIDKGKYILKVDKNLWMYFTNIKKSIRIATKDSFMGTDANNYDILEINLLEDYSVKEFEAAEFNGVHCYKVNLSAKEGTEGYDNIISWIDIANKKILQNECYSLSGVLIKTIIYAEFKKSGVYQIPVKVIIKNNIQKDQESIIEFSNVESLKKLADNIFTVGYLKSLN